MSACKDVYEYMDSMGVTWRTGNDLNRYYRGWLKTKPWYAPNRSLKYYWWADEYYIKHPDTDPKFLPELFTRGSQYHVFLIKLKMEGKREDDVPSLEWCCEFIHKVFYKGR